MKSHETDVVILAGGMGSRMRGVLPKQLLEVEAGRTVLDLSLSAYQGFSCVERIVVVAQEDFFQEISTIASRYSKVWKCVMGGASRQESALAGVNACQGKYVLIHDAARPLVSKKAVEACVEKLRAGCLCVNTVFQPPATMVVLKDKKMVSTMDRDVIALGQCPQGFEREVLLDAHAFAARNRLVFTDDCSVMLAAGKVGEVETVEGELSGFKLTYPQDMAILKIFLAGQ